MKAELTVAGGRRAAHAPGVYRNPTATDEFVAETVAGMNYLKGVCKDVGIAVN